MIIISRPVERKKILRECSGLFKDMIKAVVDVKNETMAVDAELHADLEEHMIQNGSAQEDLWGINLYLEKDKRDRVEYTALINIRPSQGNDSMEVNDPAMCEKIRKIVDRLIIE